MANVGVHGTKVDLFLDDLWAKNVSITTRLVDTVTTPMLLKMVEAKKLQPGELITHSKSLFGGWLVEVSVSVRATANQFPWL